MISLLVKNAILRHAEHIILEKTHILISCYVMGRRSYLSVPCKTNRLETVLFLFPLETSLFRLM